MASKKMKMFFLRLSKGWERCVTYIVVALLAATMSLAYSENRQEISAIEYTGGLATVGAVIFAAYSIAVAVVEVIRQAVKDEIEESNLRASLIGKFSLSIILLSITLGILLLFGAECNSVVKIVVVGLTTGCVMSIADLALTFYRMKGDNQKDENWSRTEQGNRMFTLIFILSSIIIVILMIFVQRDSDWKVFKAKTNKQINEKNAEIARLRSDSIHFETLLKGKDIHIKLDVQGIPPRQGGGITVNNVQGN